MCQKLEAEKTTLQRSHTISLRFQVHFRSSKKEREGNLPLVALCLLKNEIKHFFFILLSIIFYFHCPQIVKS